MAPSISSTREFAIAGRKRPSSPAPSDADNLSDLSDSPSDFEQSAKPTRKPVKKKPRITKASSLSKVEVPENISKDYQSAEGHSLFTAKWWKEIGRRDILWTDINKHIPKNVLAKRLLIGFATNLNEEAGKGSRSNGTTTVTASKAKKTTVARKPTQKVTQDTSSADVTADLGNTGDALSTSIQVTEEGNAQLRNKDSVMVIDNIDIDEVTKQPIEEAARIDTTTPEKRGGLISDALANQNLTPEERAKYVAINEDQEKVMRSIKEDAQAKKREEEARQKRAAAKAQKAAKEAKMEFEQKADELALEDGGSDDKGKQRQVFAPTRF